MRCGYGAKKCFALFFIYRLQRVGFGKLNQARKATGFKPLRVNCWEVNQVTSKFQMYFWGKRGFSGLKQKRFALPWNPAYLN